MSGASELLSDTELRRGSDAIRRDGVVINGNRNDGSTRRNSYVCVRPEDDDAVNGRQIDVVVINSRGSSGDSGSDVASRECGGLQCHTSSTTVASSSSAAPVVREGIKPDVPPTDITTVLQVYGHLI